MSKTTKSLLVHVSTSVLLFVGISLLKRLKTKLDERIA